MKRDSPPASSLSWRERLHEIIFEADTPAGKFFDVTLLVMILLSVIVVSLETVDQFKSPEYRAIFLRLEWAFTILFTIEYVLRLICVGRAMRYAVSFFGIVDLLSIIPTFLSFFLPGTQSLAVIRSLRLLRVFRVFKLARMLSEASTLRQAFWEARGKILVFLTTVLIIVSIAAAGIYLVETVFADKDAARPQSQFTSIPQSMYWAIVTMTTVGYGDVVPQTPLGKLLSTFVILLGYSMIVVPTGFVSAELISARGYKVVTTQSCRECLKEGHDGDAKHCKYCGTRL